MKLRKFRVQMFKCILDSGWIDVNDLTVLIGRNEAGKTALLRALHKFKPFSPEPYSIAREWPRGHRGERADTQVVCSAEFELNDGDLAALKETFGQDPTFTSVVVTRDYAGRYDVKFPGGANGNKAEAKPHSSKAQEHVISALPTFVYMDEYRAFKGSANLEQVKQRLDQGKPNEDDTTLITLMALAELSLEQELKKAATRDSEERHYDLNDAAAKLNQKIVNHWKQLRYEVDFRADGPQFMTFVRSLEDNALIRLEERSKGFQWFFSFDLTLMHETQGALKNAVILLDEPGLHLHPAAQRDLLSVLATYASDNTLIYTTHLPFMIDPRFPERIRVISETTQGTVVPGNLAEAHPGAKLVLQAALGISGSVSHQVAEQNLVVEGLDDYWILTALSEYCHRVGRPAIPLHVKVTPAGGASATTDIAALMVDRNLEVVPLYNSHGEGKAAHEQFVQHWISRYQGAKAGALSLGIAAGMPNKDLSIEDLFPEEFYLGCVEAVHGKQLAAAGASLKALPKGGSVTARVDSLFESVGLKFNKVAASKVLCAKIRAMKNLSDIPPATLKAIESLFSAITAEFAAFRAEESMLHRQDSTTTNSHGARSTAAAKDRQYTRFQAIA